MGGSVAESRPNLVTGRFAADEKEEKQVLVTGRHIFLRNSSVWEMDSNLCPNASVFDDDDGDGLSPFPRQKGVARLLFPFGLIANSFLSLSLSLCSTLVGV